MLCTNYWCADCAAAQPMAPPMLTHGERRTSHRQAPCKPCSNLHNDWEPCYSLPCKRSLVHNRNCCCPHAHAMALAGHFTKVESRAIVGVTSAAAGRCTQKCNAPCVPFHLHGCRTATVEKRGGRCAIYPPAHRPPSLPRQQEDAHNNEMHLASARLSI